MKKITTAALLALLGLSATLSYSQTIDANLVGTIVDPSGAAVPNASVEITHVATGTRTGTKTNADGQYRFNNIPIGLYNVTATAEGLCHGQSKERRYPAFQDQHGQYHPTGRNRFDHAWMWPK